jgi:TPR repeat protein
LVKMICGQDCDLADEQYSSVNQSVRNDPRLDINNPVTQFRMGLVFHLGLQGDDGVNTLIRDTATLKDTPRAARWYKRAADQGYAKAQYNLGVLYSQGDGVAKDRGVTAKLYQAAAIQNLIEAQYDLAAMLYYGDGVPKDQRQALHWWEIVAKQDPGSCTQRELHLVSKAKNNVANLHRQQVTYTSPGQAQHSTMRQAQSVFQSVAHEGSHESPEAQYRLGIMHYNGQAGAVDKAKAIELWSLAAHQGHQQAQNVLKALQKESSDESGYPSGVGGKNWTYDHFGA